MVKFAKYSLKAYKDIWFSALEDGGVSKLAPIRACKFTREVVKLFMSALHQTKLILQ